MVLVLCGYVALCLGYPYGAPEQACWTMTPNHGFKPQTDAAPYSIIVSSAEYRPGQNILVTLNATSPNTHMFKGFLIMARLANCTGADVPIGRFINVDDDSDIQMRTCPNARYKDNAVTHTWNNEKMSKSFLWHNPDGGDVYFKFTVVKQKDTFWANITTGVVRDMTKAWGSTPCANQGNIAVQQVDPSRLTTRPPTTMHPYTDSYRTDIAWPSSGASGVVFSFSLMLAVAASILL